MRKTNIKPAIAFIAMLLGAVTTLSALKVDYSVTYVPEERGSEFLKITRESDYVCMPQVSRSSRGAQWMTNRILAVSPDGKNIAYLSLRDGLTNIFIKDAEKQGASRQRTNRTAVVDFTYSPDGKTICFTESKGKTSNSLFITDAESGYVCRQITSGSMDYSPIYSRDKKCIYFCRAEKRSMSIWSYDIGQNYLSSYTNGVNPFPSKKENAIYVARPNVDGNGEIWKVNFDSGVEECILSDKAHSFYSPVISPDGTKILVVGSSCITSGNTKYWNTDIFTCDIDGTHLQQHTYHAADDLSPVWSADGKYIYFISQRGNAEGLANVWRMAYNN